MEYELAQPTKVAWTIRDFCHAISISRTTLNDLPADRKPAMVKINRRVLITESPRAYIDRIAAVAE